MSTEVAPRVHARTGLHVEGRGIDREESRAEPCVLVIFGASGDLARKALLPSLYELHVQDLLPEPFAVVGTALSGWDDDTFRRRMEEAVRADCSFDERRWEELAERLFYVSADLTAPPEEDYAALGARIDEVREELGIPDRLLFHLAIPPSFFPRVVERLEAAELARSDEGRRGWRRLVVEKPFGEDRASARRLDASLRAVFDEERIYRIDHYLGKETVQNMLVFRFGNPGFEPIWNRTYIDHVQITVAESIGIGRRAGFYERTGVVRDMLQNHLLQLLCMTAIEPPVRFEGSAVRNETVKVLDAIRPVDVASEAVRGQYGPGRIDGEAVPGYREEEGVAPDSRTPTFAAVELHIDNWRWAGVPFYLRSGKRLERKLTEVTIHFRPTPHPVFPRQDAGATGNVLAFRLQPNEGIMRTFAAKQPGPGLTIRPVRMEFCYDEAFGVAEPPRAYAWLLLDAMEGDQTLFARSDWIDRAWEIVDPAVQRWESEPPDAFPNYPAGSWGPEAADRLLSREGRRWQVI